MTFHKNFLFLLSISLIFTACAPGRSLLYNVSDIRDHKKFPKREIHKGDESFYFFEQDSSFRNSHPIIVRTTDFHNLELNKFLPETPTLAFLVIRNDSIIYENYFNKKDTASIVPSFSVAKSFTSALIGIAMDEGFIGSVEDSVSQYLEEWQGKGLENIKLKHLLKMTSGIRSGEGYYNPFSHVARLYYGRNIRGPVNKVKIEDPPAKLFAYKSFNTQILGEVIVRATGKNLSTLLEEKIWKPLGMEYDASWSIDQRGEKGIEKAFCCLNARARDYAKFGRLYLNGGNWNGKQIISKSWVEESTKIDAKDGSSWYYQYQWWIPSRTDGDFSARGHLGQYIYVNPGKKLIIVRLGKKDGDVDWVQVFKEIANKYGAE